MQKTLNYNTLMSEPVEVVKTIKLDDLLIEDDYLIVELNDGTLCFYDNYSGEVTKYEDSESLYAAEGFVITEEHLCIDEDILLVVKTMFDSVGNKNLANIYLA